MRRRPTARVRPPLAVLAVLAAAVALAGCGVPGESPVAVQGRGQAAAPALGDDGVSEPPGRAASSDPRDFVDNFLAAAAGEPEQAVARVREFLAPEVRAAWAPPPQVRVIRLDGEPIINRAPLGYEVQLRARVLGELGDRGIFHPKVSPAETFTLTLSDNDPRQSGLFATVTPSAVLLSDTALQRYYEQRTLYFWSTDHRALVPDLRYLPRRDVPAAQRPNEVINWLLQGPSPWLAPAVRALPDAAALIGIVPPPTDDTLRVTLSKAVDVDDAEAVDRLATQLRWSVRTGSQDPALELSVDQIDRSYTGTEYLAANPAYRGGRTPERYCIFADQVRRLDPDGSGGAAARDEAGSGALVPARWNSGVRRAALASEGGRTSVALVRAVRGGQVVLDVGSGAAPLDVLRRTDLRARQAGQPAWLPGSGETGLLVADGTLRMFQAPHSAVRPVANVPSGITAFAVPPDGRRLAYISGGRLFVAPLLSVVGTVTVGEPVEIPTALTNLTAVGWSQRDWVVVAGSRPGDRLIEVQDVTVDGALRIARDGQLGTRPVVHLVAATDDPGDDRGAGQVMYVVNDLAYEMFSEQRLLTARDVAGADADPQPSVGTINPAFPFFLE